MSRPEIKWCADYLHLEIYRLNNRDLYKEGERKVKEGNVLFNDTLNTFYLRLYGVRHMVKAHSDSNKGNPLRLFRGKPLLPHRLLFPISSKGTFICILA